MQHEIRFCIPTLIIFVVALVHISNSKVIHGVIPVDDSKFPYPKDLTFFCGKLGSMMTIQLNFTRKVVCSQCKIYLLTIDNWKKLQAGIHYNDKSEQEKSCQNILRTAHLYVDIIEDSLSQSVVTSATLNDEQYSCWYLVYANRATCNSMSTPAESITHQINYVLTLQNEAIDNNTITHFSAEEEGILLFYQRFTFVHFFVMCLMANSVVQVISKAGPMHQAMVQLAFAEVFLFLSLILATFHLLQYSSNGMGMPIMLFLSNCFALASRFYMFRMLCGTSFALLRGNTFLKPSRENWALTIAISSVFAEEIVIWYELFYDELHRSLICYFSLGTQPLILFRLVAFGIICYKLSEMISEARGALKREFYIRFSMCCILWLLAPVGFSCLASFFCRQYFGIALLADGTLLLQFCASFLMYRLIMSRSLYWEVSALSASILPTRIGSIHR
ncbi:Integral membrane protein GPR180 [Trichoplax sp. H2]|nr:Integral membrane protein GPR180 [Trichoplax sp. H2]|eukprot:RDD44528.1 Integral membrane protein GPR180 [Trichoplax sp. H2]